MRLAVPIVLLLLTCFLLLSPVLVSAASLVIRIEGIEDAPLENVTKALVLPAALQRDDAELKPLWRRRLVRQAPEKVRLALEPFGYYHAVVNVRLNEQASPPQLEVTIVPGDPVRIIRQQIEIEGNRELLATAISSFPLHEGDIFRHDLYEQGKSQLLGLAVDHGYLDAEFRRHQVVVDPDALSASINLLLVTGERYTIGKVHFSGASDYPEKFLVRYLTVRPGSFFSYAQLGKSRQNLLDSDRFREVVIQPRKEEAVDGQLPVEIVLDPSPPRRLRPGIGYGTDTGARLSVRGQDLNLLHRGHELYGDLLIAQLRQDISFSYILPASHDINTMTALRGGYRAENLKSYDTRYAYAEAEQLYGLGPQKTGSFFLRFLSERSDLSGDSVSSEQLIPGIRYRQSKLDNPVRPSRGYRWSVEGRGAVDLVLAGLPVLQVLGDLQVIQPLPWESLLLLRGAAGSTLQKDAFQDLPASLRFFTGGDNSVRGYAYQSLGPTNGQGEVVGGRHFLAGSIEVERRVATDWGLAAFFDMGNAFDDFTRIDARKAAGIGIRYYTPVGPARLDIARTIADPDSRFRIHIGLGVSW
ncbi:MAG: outer membrane protein assembly factor [Deltaproteobacteria bacterium]|nr:outer membrane protein assembly factor [Candidatus Anaeroferrophillus wilburensis]MBN2888007.1 outer membrane protein assembly factor [Deltaproteobacteria bacterium]